MGKVEGGLLLKVSQTGNEKPLNVYKFGLLNILLYELLYELLFVLLLKGFDTGLLLVLLLKILEVVLILLFWNGL